MQELVKICIMLPKMLRKPKASIENQIVHADKCKQKLKEKYIQMLLCVVYYAKIQS